MATAAIGTVMVAIWLLSPERAELFRASWMMKANCAFALGASGVALLLASDERWSRRRAVQLALVAMVAIVAVVTLAQYATGLDLGIDSLIAPSDLGHSAGRMAPQTAVLLLLFTGGLMTARFRSGIASHASDGAVIAIAALLHAVMAGYFHHDSAITGSTPDTHMSPQSILGFSTLWIGLLFHRAGAGAGFFQILSAEGRGSTVIRYLLPPVVVMPIIISSVRLWLEAHGAVSTPLSATVFGTLQSLFRIGFVIGLGVLLNRSEQQRREEQTRREEAERLVRICAWTSRVRWDGRWVPVDVFLKQRFNLEVTHGISEEAMAAALEEVEHRREARSVA